MTDQPTPSAQYEPEKAQMLVIPDAKMDEALAALEKLNVLTAGQSTGTDCHKQGHGWSCGDRDADHV